jgi:hypothetical protein
MPDSLRRGTGGTLSSLLPSDTQVDFKLADWSLVVDVVGLGVIFLSALLMAAFNRSQPLEEYQVRIAEPIASAPVDEKDVATGYMKAQGSCCP